jgi:hypothetical protein
LCTYVKRPWSVNIKHKSVLFQWNQLFELKDQTARKKNHNNYLDYVHLFLMHAFTGPTSPHTHSNFLCLAHED